MNNTCIYTRSFDPRIPYLRAGIEQPFPTCKLIRVAVTALAVVSEDTFEINGFAGSILLKPTNQLFDNLRCS